MASGGDVDAGEEIPEDLPKLILWFTSGGHALKSLFGRAPDAPELNARGKKLLRPYVPLAATAWKCGAMTAWRPMAELPARWGLTDASGVCFQQEDEEEALA